MKITILGAPRSKKNSRRNFGNISLPSKAFLRFEESALWQLKKVKERFKGAVSIDYVLYQKGKMIQDCNNAIAGIDDILQKAGIVEDDKFIEHGSFRKVHGCPDWWTEIFIENSSQENYDKSISNVTEGDIND